MTLSKVYTRQSDIAYRKVSDEYILVPLSDNIADMDSLYTMNEVGAFIWEQIDGKKTISQIIEQVTSAFDVQDSDARKDVLRFFDDIQIFLK